jgi:hypothetical protein
MSYKSPIKSKRANVKEMLKNLETLSNVRGIDCSDEFKSLLRKEKWYIAYWDLFKEKLMEK